MMKRFLLILIAVLLCVSLLAGCKGAERTDATADEAVTSASPTTAEPESETAMSGSEEVTTSGSQKTEDYEIPAVVLTKEEKTDYLDIVKKYEKQYGKLHDRNDDNLGYVYGVCMIKLVDFNGDGANEMVLVYREKNAGFFESVIYTYVDGQATEVKNSDIVYNSGTSVQPYLGFFYKDGKVYTKNTETVWGNQVSVTHKFITLVGDEMQTEKTFFYYETQDGGIAAPSVDGDTLTKEEFGSMYEPWDTDVYPERYQMYTLDIWEDAEFEALKDAVREAKDLLK